MWAFLATAYSAGLASDPGINTGHELDHKPTALERWLAKLVLAVPAYGHFRVEHNHGHHRHVATPEDPASACMGESIYRFARREIFGAMRRAWRIESQQLADRHRSAWSVHNEILRSHAVALVPQGGLVAVFGWVMLPSSRPTSSLLGGSSRGRTMSSTTACCERSYPTASTKRRSRTTHGTPSMSTRIWCCFSSNVKTITIPTPRGAIRHCVTFPICHSCPASNPKFLPPRSHAGRANSLSSLNKSLLRCPSRGFVL